MMSGYLKLLVMKTLSGRRLSGYDLIKQIEKDTGTWKPSFGSIYPLLDKLLREKLVRFDADGRRKVYFLTQEGKKHLILLNKSKDTLVDNMIVALNAFSKITERKDMEFMLEILRSLKKGQLPFKDINPELNEFRTALFDAYTKDKDRKKIKRILKESAVKLRVLK